MDNVFKAVRLSDHVYWVGAVDWSIRDFHGYSTNRGTTYNAFLILAEKVALIDTVKHHFMDEMISRIASVVDPQKIDYIISNHGELDHSGCLPEVIDAVKPEKVLASAKGIKCLERHFRIEQEVTPVKSGETLSLGDLTLKFMETPMLHWPESMFTMLEEEGILFSQDAFGMHLATSALFADEVEEPVLEYEASKYFANILLPYAPRIRNLLDKGAEVFQEVTGGSIPG
jgi:flavorubredoxin